MDTQLKAKHDEYFCLYCCVKSLLHSEKQKIRLTLDISLDIIFNSTTFCFRLANEIFSKSKNLIVLGNLKTSRLPVFSFLIQHKESGLFLHHNFVSSLLNDLFGIQSRGGCACAGPYAQVFLCYTAETTHAATTCYSKPISGCVWLAAA